MTATTVPSAPSTRTDDGTERGGDDGTARRADDATPGVFLVLAELGLLAAALGTAAGFSRLFIGWGFLGELAVPVVACWASTLVLRRVRAPVPVAVVASSALGAVALTWRFAPGTTVLGVPTPSSLGALQDALQASFGDFSRLVAPVPATQGFLVVLAGILWIFGFFADTATFRYRGPVQAVIPYVATFIASGVLARDSGRTQAALLFVAGMACYVVTQRALQASERRWIRGEAGRGTWAVAAAGGAVAAVAVLAGVLVGPRLPGDTNAVVDLRALGRGGGARTVVSPFVGVRTLLGPQSDQVVFTVETDTPTYWRLTSLEQYDATRDIWISRGSYKRVEGDLGARIPAGVPTTRSRQSFHIDGLGGLWLPASFQPVSIRTDLPISYDAGSSSVIARDDSLRSGTTYRVDSEVPDLTPADLDAAAAPDRIDPVYTSDAGVSAPVRRTARAVTRDAITPYAKARALQDWFRSDGFTYDTEVDYREDADPVDAFLIAKKGFCQQFASAYALMARAIGLPSRVAVGFTQGDGVAQLPGSGKAGFVVRGRHAHAWPEVYFDGIGWVPFEPTTGRGNPQAETYTDVPAAQAAPTPQQAETTTTAPTTSAPGQAPTTIAPASGAVDATTNPSEQQAASSSDSGGTTWWLVVGGLVVVVLAALGLARLGAGSRRRRRLRSDPHGGRVAAAWDDAVGWLSVVDLRPGPDETPFEFAARAGADRRLHPADVDGPPTVTAREAADALDRLAWAETVRRFGAGEPSEETCGSAEEAAGVVREAVRSASSRVRRVRHLVG